MFYNENNETPAQIAQGGSKSLSLVAFRARSEQADWVEDVPAHGRVLD